MASTTRRPARRTRWAMARFALLGATATLTAGSTFTTGDTTSAEVVTAAGPSTTTPPQRPGPTGAHPVLPHGAGGLGRHPTSTVTSSVPATTAPPSAPPPAAPRTTPAPAPPTPPGSTATPPAPVAPAQGRVPCDLTPAAEACWASHTGVPGWSGAQIVAGRSPLEHVVGDVAVTVPGTVIDGKWIDGCISVEANDVTIRNTLVRTQNRCYGGNGQAAGSAINIGNAQRSSPGVVSGLLITDSEVDAMDAPFDAGGIGAHGYTCVRCNVHGGVKNLWATDGVTIRDSYIHHPSTANGTIHSESINADSGGRVTVDHSFVSSTGTSYVTGAVAFLASWGPGHDLTINESFLEGGEGADLAIAPVNTGIRITNNAFSNVNGYDGTTFVYGFDPSNPGMVWSGNRIAQTGAELPMPSSP